MGVIVLTISFYSVEMSSLMPGPMVVERLADFM